MDWRRERRIRSVLRKLARQRVATILQSGNVLVIEKAIKPSDEVNADLFTAYLRGWVEPFPEAIPSENITEDGLPPDWPGFTQAQVVYRLTEGGWVEEVGGGRGRPCNYAFCLLEERNA